MLTSIAFPMDITDGLLVCRAMQQVWQHPTDCLWQCKGPGARLLKCIPASNRRGRCLMLPIDFSKRVGHDSLSIGVLLAPSLVLTILTNRCRLATHTRFERPASNTSENHNKGDMSLSIQNCEGGEPLVRFNRLVVLFSRCLV